MATRAKTTASRSDHLRLEGEVVGLWFQVQGRLEAHFTELAAQHGLSAVQAKVLLQLPTEGASTMRALAGQLPYHASNLTGVVHRPQATGGVRRRAHPPGRGGKR